MISDDDLIITIHRQPGIVSGVCVKHIPSQLGISVNSESSVIKNKQKALKLLTQLLKNRKLI